MKFDVRGVNQAVSALHGVSSPKAYRAALRSVARLDPLVQLAMVDSILVARGKAGF